MQTKFDKNLLLEKYKDIFKYCCYNDDDEICNDFSVNFNYICKKCVKKNNTRNIKNIQYMQTLVNNYNNKESIFVQKMGEYINQTQNPTKKSVGEENKLYNTKMCFEVFKIIYYNPIILLCQPRLLIVAINKTYELILTENNHFENFIINYPEYKSVYNFMKNLDNFSGTYFKSKPVNMEQYIKKENINELLDNYNIFLHEYYDNILQNTNTNTNIDIDNICDSNFVIDL